MLSLRKSSSQNMKRLAAEAKRKNYCPSPFKGEVRRGMGFGFIEIKRNPSPPPPSP
jgi:hypothetical protein